jgi:hypothetical protein
MDKKQAQQELDQIKDRVKELERIMNEPEVSKEKEMSDFLFSMLANMESEITGEKETTFYRKSDHEWLIQQDYKNGYLRVRYSLIWSIFGNRFKLDYNQISHFIHGWIEINVGWKGLIPYVLII